MPKGRKKKNSSANGDDGESKQTARTSGASAVSTPVQMINLSLPTPEAFSFASNEWGTWKNRFQRYRRGCGLDNTSDSRQIDVLLFTMGSRSEDIFESFSPTPTTYEEALTEFDKYFIPRRNIIYERTKFLRHKQGSDSAEKFITDLHGLAKTCEWGDLYDDMLLLVLIIGMRETAISDKLQLDHQLTLDRATTTLRQNEELQRQKEELRETSISAVDKKPDRKRTTRPDSKPREKPRTESGRGKKCNKCGFDWHGTLAECPARKAKCDKCSEIGHFIRCCPSRRKVVREVEHSESEGEPLGVPEIFVGSVNKGDKAWMQELKVSCGGQNLGHMKFKLDTAADVTMVPIEAVRTSIRMLPLKKCLSKVFSAKKAERLEILGTIRLELVHKGRHIQELAYISEEVAVPLLSRRACEELNLVKRVFSLNSDTDWVSEFPELFRGLGNMKGEYRIEMKENAVPYAISTPRAVPLPLKAKVKSELDDMLRKGVIVPVEHATDWCAPMVVVAKKGGGIRICVDLSKLNSSVKRQFHPIPKIELSLAEVAGAKFFSKIDANSGFWQLNLAKESQDYTTFITPFGRFKFCKLPFGITSAPEEFQRRMSKALENAKNCIVHIDDCLIWGRTKEEHDECLRAVLHRILEEGITLNKQKSEFCKEKVTFLGFVLSKEGIQPDPSKVQAIVDLKPPATVTEVQRFMGMVTFLAKFIPNRSEILEPITSLLKSNNEFIWGLPQERAFSKVKEILASKPCLTMYDPMKPSILSCDASKKGLGAVLLQVEGKDKKPVAYISRTLTSAEQNYSNIEREALACAWASDRLKCFLLGKQYTIETDHKPLPAIFKTKNLDELTPRLQRFRLRMMRYEYCMIWTPGKDMLIADFLSRDPRPSTGDGELAEEVEAFIHEVSMVNINTSDQNVTKVLNSQMRDPICAQLKSLILDEWPGKSDLPIEIQEYFSVKDELSCTNGLLLRGNRMVIPLELRKEMLDRLHSGHLGITKTRKRALGTMWWPGISGEIERKIKSCPVCIQNTTNHSEPLIPRKLPDYPWQNVSMDLFKYDNKWYIVIVDHYSRFFEVEELKRLRALDVINACKSAFSRFGVPESVFSDSGTQFHYLESSEFKLFAQKWGFSTFRSSPHHHQANGAAEAAVKIAKGLMKKNKDDFELALLSYRTTPLETGSSPAELMYKRTVRNNLPSAVAGKPSYDTNFHSREEKYQQRYKQQFDRRHGAKELSVLKNGEAVWITDLRRHGKIVRKLKEPRSYLVETDKRTVRRNRVHLVPAPYYTDENTSTLSYNASDLNPPPPDLIKNSPDKKTIVRDLFTPADDRSMSSSTSRPQAASGTTSRFGRPLKKPQRY